ncbi:MAG: carA [Firmicutes bacterium]|nr:carA [Bacillota bacterium]
MKGKLILEDGSTFAGELLGNGQTVGEVVFNTGMTGYQEVLTDPSYCGQIVTMTYPLIGNYGTAALFNQAEKSYVRGFIIGELCFEHSNWRAEESLPRYLEEKGIPCLYGVDTRAVTRKIRSAGTMKGIIVPETTTEANIAKLMASPLTTEVVAEVTPKETYHMGSSGPKVAVLDYGIKRNILHSLVKAGCDLTILPAFTTAEEVLALDTDGIFLSNGPGDPKDVPQAIETVKALLGKKPIFGICLGHQLLALAMGANTYKLKFGHRGSNHPVKDMATGRVYITSQNHGYAVEENTLEGKELVITHRAVNDGTVEGMKHSKLPVFSVQYHPEAAPGPDDNTYLFDEFMALMKKGV